MKNSPLDQKETLLRLDRSRMVELLKDFSQQVEAAVRIGEAFRIPSSLEGRIEKILFAGMGGSAIGGDVLRSLLTPEVSIPIFVSRHYEIPPLVDSKTLCIFSSYSGNTEETISAFRQGMKRKSKALVITSGGELARLSERARVPWVGIPPGFPPRAALGYSVFPILRILARLKIGRWDARGAEETLSFLEAASEKQLGPQIPLRSNPAKRMAPLLRDRLVVIYAGTELLDSAALRFRSQIEENAKAMASHHLFPEMNHNEILGWSFPEKLISSSVAVFLRDAEDHPRIRLRMDLTQKLLQKQGASIQELHTEGKSRLARLFSMIYLGDWISFYLALLYGVDPTPVAVIESLKKELARAGSPTSA